MGWILDLYENLRKTKPKVESDKPKERNYTFDAGFSGDRKTDCQSCKPQQTVNKVRSKETNDRDDR